jgi:hypothetical protein
MILTTGNGTSMPEIKDPEDLFLWFKLSFATYLFWVINVAIVQLAVLSFYQRMFWVVTWFRRACYALMAISVVWCIGLFITRFTICTPVAKNWGSRAATGGKCGDRDKMCNAFGLTHSILDFLVLFVPVPLIWGLKISFKRKVAVSMLFLAGIL